MPPQVLGARPTKRTLRTGSGGPGGRGPDIGVISRAYLTVPLRWDTKRSERVPTGSSYTSRPLIDLQNHPFRATGG